MHPLIDPGRQEKAWRYEKRKDILGITGLAISILYTGAFFFTGASREAAAFASRAPMPLALVLYFLFFVPLWILLFPLTFVKEHVIEKEYGLTTQTVRSWLFDRAKGLLLSVLFGYPLLLLLFSLFRRVSGHWWIFAASGMFLVQIFVAVIFPVLLFPIFFKQKPLEDEKLRRAVTDLLDKAGITFRGIYSFNLSAKTTKENAALAGLWKTRRILLADTLLARHDLDETLAVLAHEAGHHKGKHMMKLSLFELAVTFVILYALHRVMGLFTGFPGDFQRTLALVPLIVLAAGAISFPFRILMNAYSRQKEREADAQSLVLTGNRDAFIRLMAGLANTNLAVAYPKKLKVFLFHTHPPIGERISEAERWEGRKTSE